MKKIIMIMVVTALVAGAAFARGNNEENRGSNQGSGMRFDGESVLISGTVAELDGQVVLESGGELYSLSAPGFYRSGVEVPFGETVEVSGSMINEPCGDCGIDADGHIFVAGASAGGEEISFETGRGNQQGSASRDGSGRNNSGNRQGGNRQGGNRQGGNRQGNGRRNATS